MEYSRAAIWKITTWRIPHEQIFAGDWATRRKPAPHIRGRWLSHSWSQSKGLSSAVYWSSTRPLASQSKDLKTKIDLSIRIPRKRLSIEGTISRTGRHEDEIRYVHDSGRLPGCRGRDGRQGLC